MKKMTRMTNMKRQFTRSLAIVAVAGLLLFTRSALTAQVQDKSAAALKSAMDKETLDGDLKGAIEQYKKLADSSKDRSIAAKALVRMADAYGKLNDAESRRIYERIVKDYGDQAEAVSQARRRLAALDKPYSSNVLTSRLLCSDCGDPRATLSPDGRLMAQQVTENGDVVIRDLSTGQVRRLLADKESKDPNEYSEWATVSPNSRQVLFFWFMNNHEPGRKWELRLMPNEPGSKSRLVMRIGEEIRWISPGPWSADGHSILVTIQRPDETWQIARLSLSDGAIKVLKSLEWRLVAQPGLREARLSLSPDGRYIAYSALAKNPPSASAASRATESHIYLLPADGSGPETEVVKSASVNESPTWTPDGAHLLFVSNRGATYGLWSVAVRNGQAVSSPKLLKGDTGRIYSIGMTPSGSYYYVVHYQITAQDNPAPREEIVIRDLTRGNGESGNNRTPQTITGYQVSWSPDGKSLAFTRRAARNPRVPNAQAHDLVIYNVETGAERIYPAEGMESLPRRPLWFHDGKAVLQLVRREIGNAAFNRVDLSTGEFKPLVRINDSDYLTNIAALAPDDRTLYVVARAGGNVFPNRACCIVSIDLASGERKQVLALPERELLSELAVSPDGRTLALVSRGGVPASVPRLDLVAVDGGSHRKLYGASGRGLLDKLVWTSDSRTVVFGQSSDKPDHLRTLIRSMSQIMRIPVDGMNPDFTGLELPIRQTFDLSPDGSRIAYDANNPVSELWALDNIPAVLSR